MKNVNASSLGTVKILLNHFFKKNKISSYYVNFYEREKALIHSILISEVKDTKSHVLQGLWKIQNKKTLKFHLKLNFNNFKKEKWKSFGLTAMIFSHWD